MTQEQLGWWQTLEGLEKDFSNEKTGEPDAAKDRAKAAAADAAFANLDPASVKTEIDAIWKELYDAEDKIKKKERLASYSPTGIDTPTFKLFSPGVKVVTASLTGLDVGATGFSFTIRGSYFCWDIKSVYLNGVKAKLTGSGALMVILSAATAGVAGLAVLAVQAARLRRSKTKAVNSLTAAMENAMHALNNKV